MMVPCTGEYTATASAVCHKRVHHRGVAIHNNTTTFTETSVTNQPNYIHLFVSSNIIYHTRPGWELNGLVCAMEAYLVETWNLIKQVQCKHAMVSLGMFRSGSSTVVEGIRRVSPFVLHLLNVHVQYKLDFETKANISIYANIVVHRKIK